MTRRLPRRAFLTSTPVALAAASALLAAGDSPSSSTAAPAGFPAQDPARVREMVGVAHGNVSRVKELLAESPALANATWDWGFGDWETAIGAASHVGNREIAQLLIENRARPDLFTFAMLGQLAVVRAYIEANPGVQGVFGPHGLTLLHHARKGGDLALPVVEYLEQVGGADRMAKSQPLTPEELNGCPGTYAFGSGADETLSVSVKDGMLQVQRVPDGANRGLVHLANLEFHPVGAPAVRIRFSIAGGRAARLAVVDGPTTITALRS